jgi:hypothetical protein
MCFNLKCPPEGGLYKSVQNPQAEQAAEKLNILSFRGTLRAEESLYSWLSMQREIRRFARNDKINYFFRSL